MVPTAPLVLTLLLDPTSQDFFDARRRAHFPPERNHLAAHLTLFHALPGAEAAAIEASLAVMCATQSPLDLSVRGVQFLGRGVAYSLESAELRTLHRRLQQPWQPWLTPQDRQPLRPHVTVQNKVDPTVARALFARLEAEFVPFPALGMGLQLWTYRGGPWEARASWVFGGK